MQQPKLKVLSLFCGCGGLDYGFHTNDAFEVARSYDSMKHAIDTYELNFPGISQRMDVNRLLESDFELGFDPDVIIGGPPCQDFSMAGKQQLGHRANLTETFIRIVCAYKPKYFVMENVVTIKSVGKEIYTTIIDMLKNANYGVSQHTAYMPDYGIPQKRKRLVLIGELNGVDGAFESAFQNSKQPVASMREYMSQTGIDLGFGQNRHVYRHPRSYKARGVFSIDELYPTVRGCLCKLPQQYTFHPLDTSHDRNDIASPLWTTIARLQTFPVDFKFLENRYNVLIIGNAVPPRFSQVVASMLAAKHHLFNNTTQP